MHLAILLVTMVSLVRMSGGQFTRDALYHAMNDRGVYLPDDYNSDLPPAQVASASAFFAEDNHETTNQASTFNDYDDCID